MKLIKRKKVNDKDSPHEIYSIDALMDRKGVELHRFTNAAGVPYSAIYRWGNEEMSAERDREDEMLMKFRERLFTEATGGARWVFPF